MNNNDDDPQTIEELFNLTKHMNDNLEILENNIDNLPTELTTEASTTEEQTTEVQKEEPKEKAPSFRIIEPPTEQQKDSIEAALDKARKGPEKKGLFKRKIGLVVDPSRKDEKGAEEAINNLGEEQPTEPKKKIKLDKKKIKLILKISGVLALLLVYNYVIKDILFPKVTLKLNEKLGQEDIEKLVKDKTVLYITNKNGINIMRFTKTGNEFYLEVKRKVFILESDAEVTDNENPNAKFTLSEVDYKMIRYAITTEDGDIRIKDEGNDITLEFVDNKLKFQSNIEEYQEYTGKYEPIKINVKKIKYPFTFKDKYEGFYSARDKTGNIYIRLSEKATSSYSMTGTISNDKNDYYIVFEIAPIKDNKATLRDDVNFKFDEDKLTIEVGSGNKKGDVLQGKYKKETQVLAKDLIEELDEAVTLNGEGSVG